MYKCINLKMFFYVDLHKGPHALLDLSTFSYVNSSFEKKSPLTFSLILFGIFSGSKWTTLEMKSGAINTWVICWLIINELIDQLIN